MWPELWPAIEHFRRITTQWRCGGGGPIGLDYGILYANLDRDGVTGADRDDLLGAIAVIESAALEQIHSG